MGPSLITTPRSAGSLLCALILPLALASSPTSAASPVASVDVEPGQSASEASADAALDALATVPHASYGETVELDKSGREATELSEKVTLAPVKPSDAAVTIVTTQTGAEETSLTIQPTGHQHYGGRRRTPDMAGARQ